MGNEGRIPVVWPCQGATEKELKKQLAGFLDNNIGWGQEPILGFPSMSPHRFGLEIFTQFQACHPNAILTHTRGKGEKGFDGVKTIEREVIYMVADLLGCSNPEDNIDG